MAVRGDYTEEVLIINAENMVTNLIYKNVVLGKVTEKHFFIEENI